MGEKSERLELLRRELPEVPGAPEIEEETGEEYHRGFSGDFSRSPRYVTDGHLLLVSSAIDPAVQIWRDESLYLAKYATEDAVEKVMAAAREREEVASDFIGVCDYPSDFQSGIVPVAFVRDGLGRVMVLNAHKLAFAVRAVRPDALAVSAAPVNPIGWLEPPLALKRGGELVGLLMPMKLGADDFPVYDLHGAAVDLAAVRR